MSRLKEKLFGPRDESDICEERGHDWRFLTEPLEATTARGETWVAHAKCRRCGWLEGSEPGT